MSANTNMEAAIELAERETAAQCLDCLDVGIEICPRHRQHRRQTDDNEQPASTLRTFAEIQREWLDATDDMTLLDRMVLGNRLILEAHLSGQHEAYGKVKRAK